jgi:zinc-ribbon domain
MGLFGRKRREDEVEERCPHCNEPVPEGAVECMMCGIDLRPLGAARAGDAPQGVTSPRRIA